MRMTRGGIYLFTGPDRYRKREGIEAIAQALPAHPLDRHDANATQLSASPLIALARAHPVASPVRLIVIDEAERLEGACLEALKEQAEVLKLAACLILLVEGEIDANHPLTALKPQAAIERFDWLAPDQVSQWIRRYVATHRKRLAEKAIQDLLQAYGADLAAIRAVLDQLITWVGTRPQLTQADVRVFFPVSATPGSFDLVNAIAKRETAMALRVLQEQLAVGEEALKLLGQVAWQLQRWLMVSRLVEGGVSRERIAQLSGIRPWQLERLQRELAGRSPEFLSQVLHQCWELDLAAKSGQVPILRAALEQLIVELCLSSTEPAQAGLQRVAA